MNFREQDSGPPTTQDQTTDPAQPSRAAVEPTDEDLAGTSEQGEDATPSIQSGIPSEGVSESTPGDGL